MPDPISLSTIIPATPIPGFVYFCLGGGLFSVVSALYMRSFSQGFASQDDEASENTQPASNHKERSRTIQQIDLIIATTSEGFWMIDPSTTQTVTVNDALCKMLGYSEPEMLGLKVEEICEASSLPVLRKHLALLDSTQQQEYELTLITKGGNSIVAKFNTTILRDPLLNTVKSVFSFVKNITEERHNERELYRLAHYDATTDMPNRNLLNKHINAAIETNEPFGLLLLSMQNIKLYSSTLGHDTGDMILSVIASRLTDYLEKTDFIARFGDAEFAIVSFRTKSSIMDLATELLEVVKLPQQIGDSSISIDACAGISMYPQNGNNTETLLKCADIAMQQARQKNKGNLCIFNRETATAISKKLDISNRLRKALERGEFELFYQPQVSTTSNNQIVGVEALLRWNGQDESIPPSEFIPILEETGLIITVGKWVIDTACRQAADWYSAGTPVRISVNISPLQFQNNDLPKIIKNALDENSNLPASCLCLEITESLLMEYGDDVIGEIRRIADMGITFSIDDFGTGYSSLSSIHQLPIKEIKIDRSFIKKLPECCNSGNLIKTIVAMAQMFKADTVAEGIETPQQMDLLVSLGVTSLQGYMLGRPMPASEIRPLLSKNSKSPDKISKAAH